MKNQNPSSQQLQPIVNLFTQKRYKQTLSESSQMLKKFPNSIILFNIIGASNAALMQFDAAIESYKKALEIQPDYADANNNMGIAFNEMGDSIEAIDCFKNALKINPNHPDAYNNMGIALNEKGESKAAIESYKKALKIRPDYADAHNNMGIALNENGDLELAIESYKKALEIRPDSAEAYFNMGVALKGVMLAKPISGLQEIISSIIDRKNYVRPIDVSQASINLLKFEPIMKQLFEKHFLSEKKQSVDELISSLSKFPLLFKLMRVCPLPDLELEAVFTDIRFTLLTTVTHIENSPEVLQFQSVLALQCFTNEYVYNQNDEETRALEALEIEVREIFLKEKQPRPQLVLCLAAYKPLHQYQWCDLLNLNSTIEEVVTRQIFEPQQETLLKSNILVLQEITNKVSTKVSQQYEENPYPRWVNTGLVLNPAPISKAIKEQKLRLFDKVINVVDAPNILVAGCGTGQHSISTAARFKNAKVLAIDLSLSSLSYAERKTRELGFQNIDYMQADILDLDKLNRKFDIIESSGVLHHMDKPMAGWKILTDCLKPGGLMRIGLYSELARQHILKIRKEIKLTGIGASTAAIKSFRSDLINSNEEHHKRTQSTIDFFSLSELRDLLFHVQEHRFTIPQIKDCLSKLDLKFCGFETNEIVWDFKLKNTGIDDPYNLDKWHLYEKANPHSFYGMYQFWCQKVS
jgi:Tfp pilus assembly protein PilF/2-polyprenyl-3-methyl-5-hydroxy-6-metoxy-1,4-benzoquinol methylase